VQPPPKTRPRPAEDDVPTLDFASDEEERPVRPKRQETRPIRRGRDEDEDEDDEEEEEEDDRPVRRRGGRRRPGQQWADCPNCRAPGDATRIWWTFWGGLIGPAIINCVRCNRCGTTYNGNHGDYNTTRILIYVGVIIGVALLLAVCGGIAGSH
jgi:hypothetical protein